MYKIMNNRLPVFLIIVAVFSLLLSGCSAEFVGSGTSTPDNTDNRPGDISLNICIPGVTPETVGTRALDTGDECSLPRELTHVLLFRRADDATDDTDASYVYHRRIAPSSWGAGVVNASGNYEQPFRINLAGEPLDTRLRAMIVGNISEADMAATEAGFTGVTLADAGTLVRFVQPDGSLWNTTNPGFTPLPLWGRSATPFTPQDVSAARITLVRAVARIDVGVNLTGADGMGRYDLSRVDGQPTDLDGHKFELVSVDIRNATRSGSVGPATANYDGILNLATTATTDATTAYHTMPPLCSYADETGGATNMIRRRIYLPEVTNRGVTDNNRAFHIIVGGRYNDGPTTFYRLDFYDRDPDGDGTPEKPSAANRYDILRNHAYIINILRVRGSGYATPELASASEPVNMEVTIRSWDTGTELSNICTDGQYRLALSTSLLQYHTDGSALNLSVFTDYLLATNPDASGWRMNVVGGAAHEDLLLFYDTAGNSIAKDDWETAGVTHGPANVSAALRVGLAPYTATTDGNMERTVILRFTAGRMTMDVYLIQDVLSTVTLNLIPDAITFTRAPRAPQFVTARLSPAEGATLYACWTEGEGTAAVEHRYNISDPTSTENNGVIIPEGFVDDADDTGRAFFTRESDAAAVFALLPTKWDAAANGGTVPTAPRRWHFTLLADWGSGRIARAPLAVEQSELQLSWELLESDGGTPIPDNTLLIPARGGVQTAWAATNAGLRWYLPSYIEEGNFTGEQWLRNWPELTGTTFNGSAPLTFNVSTNQGIAQRTMTIQASASAEGFPHDENRITLRQEGGDLVLELRCGVGTEPTNLTYDAATRTYLLDYDLLLESSLKGVSVHSNTDWWWQYAPGGSTVTDPYSHHLIPGHPYYENWLVQEMNSVVTAGENTPTTDNSGDHSTLRTWDNAFRVRSPRGYFLSTDATTDAELIARNIPLAGTYFTELQLSNRHDRINPADPDEADRIQAASKRLRIRRMIPSLWHASTLPFGGADFVNMVNFSGAGSNQWDQQRLVFSGNTPVTMTIERNGLLHTTRTLTPIATYETLDIPNVLRDAVDPADVDFAREKVTYTLRLTGRRQLRANQPDEEYTLTRTYFTGYRVELPHMVNVPRGIRLNNQACEVLFDFSKSTFHNAQRVRIARQGFTTYGEIVPNDLTHTTYTLDGSHFQRYISYTAPNNTRADRMYVYYIEYIPYGETEWTGTFADGVTSAPTSREFLFLQDALSPSGNLVYGARLIELHPTWLGRRNFEGTNLAPYVASKILNTALWTSTHTCGLTARTFTAITTPGGGGYYLGPGDNRGVRYADTWAGIYGQPAAVLANIAVQTWGKCTSGISKHWNERRWNVWKENGASEANLGWTQPCGTIHGLFGEGLYESKDAEIWLIDERGNKSNSISVVALAGSFTQSISSPPLMAPDLYGTKD